MTIVEVGDRFLMSSFLEALVFRIEIDELGEGYVKYEVDNEEFWTYLDKFKENIRLKL